jgi:hypothetical protein
MYQKSKDKRNKNKKSAGKGTKNYPGKPQGERAK